VCVIASDRFPGVRGTNAGRAGSGPGAARDLFHAARFAECLTALGTDGDLPSTLLRARCLLRLGMPDAAATILRRDVPPQDDACGRTEHAVLCAAAFHALGDDAESRARLATARSQADAAGGAAEAEVHLLCAAAALRTNDLAAAGERARRALQSPALRNDLYGMPLAAVRAQVFELLATIAESREEYAVQAELLQAGWQSLYRDPHEPPDRFVEARLLERLAPLVLELCIDGVAPQLHAALLHPWPQPLSGVPWTVQRTLAWQAALAGDMGPAFARLLACVTSAPSETRRLVSIADRAQLAHDIRNDIVAYEELRRLSVLARDVDWSSVTDEGRRVLLAIATAFAPEDAPVARAWLSLYRRRGMTASAAAPRRRCALEADAEAAVLEAESRGDRALLLRRRTLQRWEELGHRLRAAREALAIARLSGAPDDVRNARALCAAFPKSWLHRRARRMPAARGSEASGA
jgi:hypothetical protein